MFFAQKRQMSRIRCRQAVGSWRFALLAAAWFLAVDPLAAAPDHCAICGSALTNSFYTMTDQVTGQKAMICQECLRSGARCFICSLPVKEGATRLPDGRFLCPRDAASAVLADDRAVQIGREVRDSLDHLFSRFLAFPDGNVSIGVVDRIHLQQLFRLAGRDYACPNVLGYLQTRTNHARIEHSLSLMSGLPLAELKATAAHEYGHAWLNQNLSERRKRTLGRDANEGFCELLAYLLMDALNEEAEKQLILRNAYTRGQIHLFVDAQQRFGLNDVLDWVKYGTDSQLSPDDPDRAHRVRMPSAGGSTPWRLLTAAPPPAAPSTLVLKGILWSPTHPQALLNDRLFEPNESGKVRVGGTNLSIRCLEVREDSVRIRILDSGEEKELRLKTTPR